MAVTGQLFGISLIAVPCGPMQRRVSALSRGPLTSASRPPRLPPLSIAGQDHRPRSRAAKRPIPRAGAFNDSRACVPGRWVAPGRPRGVFAFFRSERAICPTASEGSSYRIANSLRCKAHFLVTTGTVEAL